MGGFPIIPYVVYNPRGVSGEAKRTDAARKIGIAIEESISRATFHKMETLVLLPPRIKVLQELSGGWFYNRPIAMNFRVNDNVLTAVRNRIRNEME